MEREAKGNKSENEKDIVKERDAYRKKQERNLETEGTKKQRKEMNAASIKKMREEFLNESIQERRRRLRIKKHIGIEDGE